MIRSRTKGIFSGEHFLKRCGQLLVIGGVLTLVLMGAIQPRIAALRSAQGLYIPDSHYEFPSQGLGVKTKTLSHTFTLYNGRAHSVAVEADADCGCTGLSWQNAILPPFGRKNITASMNSSNSSASVGIIFKTEDKNYVFANLKQRKP